MRVLTPRDCGLHRCAHLLNGRSALDVPEVWLDDRCMVRTYETGATATTGASDSDRWSLVDPAFQGFPSLCRNFAGERATETSRFPRQDQQLRRLDDPRVGSAA